MQHESQKRKQHTKTGTNPLYIEFDWLRLSRASVRGTSCQQREGLFLVLWERPRPSEWSKRRRLRMRLVERGVRRMRLRLRQRKFCFGWQRRHPAEKI